MTSIQGHPALIFIVGPTAVGKSEAALDIAERLDAEIINADAMQLYRGMDIGTAKVPVEQRRSIVHHMIDVLDVRDEASVAVYQRTVREIIGSRPDTNLVVVGGSGLYISALLQDLHFPASDPVVRARLTQEAEEIGGIELHRRLSQLDPAAAIAILPTNTRRVIRALEVVEVTGAPFTANLPRSGQSPYPQALRLGLVLDRADLDRRIEIRVEEMWAAGLDDEVTNLESAGLRESVTARAALGYAQILAARDAGVDSEQALQATALATKRFARRQLSWFRRDSKIEWIPTGTHLDWLQLNI